MKYIIDLDDTLIYSTKLNNDAYNYALDKFNLPKMETNTRITRASISHIKYHLRKKIIREKQRYFSLDWLRYRLIVNTALIEKLKSTSPMNCYLWTKANKERVLTILKECDLSKYFCRIIFDKKVSYEKSKQMLVRITKSNDFIIYENNHSFFKNHNAKEIDKIKSKIFNVIGYKI